MSKEIQAQRRYAKNLAQAETLLTAYFNGDANAIARFQGNHPLGQTDGFVPTLQDARLIVSAASTEVRRLSLEKLKKEAKDLLKGLKGGHLDALERYQQNHPKATDKPTSQLKLADAQWMIARENGMPSWPRLKAHVALMNRVETPAQRARFILDRDMTTIHIRCGSDIKTVLPDGGFKGDYLEISNPFPQGEVMDFEPLERFVDRRTRFIEQSYGGDVPVEWMENTADEIRHVEVVLCALPDGYGRIALWFEHDPFDQLCLAYVLAHLAANELGDVKIELISAEGFPGVAHFIGIGQLCRQPESLIALWQARVEVNASMIAFGARCWQAFIASDPTPLWHLTQEESAPLPLMRHAFYRMLQELPWVDNGLSLTERLALKIIDKEGPITLDKVFQFLMTEVEPLPYLGDIMFLSVVRPLWSGKVAALSVLSCDATKPPLQQDLLCINDVGKALLAGELHWLSLNASENDFSERWMGGVLTNASGRGWHWSDQQKKPVLLDVTK